MPFIIDGHNLLWSICQASKDGESIDDVGMCRVVGKYLQLVGDKGEMVFDGTGPPDKSGFDNISNLEVMFSGLASDCDTVIEHKISVNTAPKRLRIVSSDRRLRDAARARKAASLKSEVFWVELQKELRRKQRRRNEPSGKRHGLSESETEQWLEFFDLEQ